MYTKLSSGLLASYLQTFISSTPNNMHCLFYWVKMGWTSTGSNWLLKSSEDLKPLVMVNIPPNNKFQGTQTRLWIIFYLISPYTLRPLVSIVSRPYDHYHNGGPPRIYGPQSWGPPSKDNVGHIHKTNDNLNLNYMSIYHVTILL